MPACRHCETRPAMAGRKLRKGLCWRCAGDPAVSARYPSRSRHTGEPTAAELERVIAEQMLCLPWWWDAERKKLPPGPRVAGAARLRLVCRKHRV